MLAIEIVRDEKRTQIDAVTNFVSITWNWWALETDRARLLCWYCQFNDDFTLCSDSVRLQIEIEPKSNYETPKWIFDCLHSIVITLIEQFHFICGNCPWSSTVKFNCCFFILMPHFRIVSFGYFFLFGLNISLGTNPSITVARATSREKSMPDGGLVDGRHPWQTNKQHVFPLCNDLLFLHSSLLSFIEMTSINYHEIRQVNPNATNETFFSSCLFACLFLFNIIFYVIYFR